MKKKHRIYIELIIAITATIAFLCVAYTVNYTSSKYVHEENGNVEFSVAKPICNLIIDSDMCISNYKSKPLYFSVNNFDENGNISDVAMEYFISFMTSQNNAPLNYTLYKLKNNGDVENTEQLTSINGIDKTLYSHVLDGSTKQTQKYKLVVNYDMHSDVVLDDNINISIILDSEQIRP